jgi:hypothetical protein
LGTAAASPLPPSTSSPARRLWSLSTAADFLGAQKYPIIISAIGGGVVPKTRPGESGWLVDVAMIGSKKYGRARAAAEEVKRRRRGKGEGSKHVRCGGSCDGGCILWAGWGGWGWRQRAALVLGASCLWHSWSSLAARLISYCIVPHTLGEYVINNTHGIYYYGEYLIIVHISAIVSLVYPKSYCIISLGWVCFLDYCTNVQLAVIDSVMKAYVE